MTTCKQCHKPLNPVAAMLGPVCGECCRKNHAAVVRPHTATYARQWRNHPER